MKINYKYSRNNAQFLYDLSCTSTIDQLIRRLTGRQIVTNDDGEKEHVDPAFNVDEILINNVEIFNREEHEAVYDSIDKLRAPWDGTEDKNLSDEDAKRRNADLTKAVSLFTTYNDRFVKLDKYLSLLPSDVRKIPNEFMLIGVNGFYRTVSIHLGLEEYLNEISTDKEAFKLFNTAEEQNQAMANVMNVIDFLAKLDESAQELFDSDDASETDEDQQNTPAEDSQTEAGKGQQNTPAEDGQTESGKGQQNTPAEGSQTETDEGQQNTPAEDGQTETDEGQQNTLTEGSQTETDEGQQNTLAEGSQTEAGKGQRNTPVEDGQTETDEGQQNTPAEDGQTEAGKEQQNVPAGEGQSENGAQQDVPNDSTKDTPNGDQHKDALNGDTKDVPTGNEDQLTGTAATEAQLFPDISMFLDENN